MRRLVWLAVWAGVAWGQGGVEVLPPVAPVGDVKPELVLQTGHTIEVRCVAFSRDGRMLCSAGCDGIRLWDVESHQPVFIQTGGDLYLNRVAFSPDGAALAAAEESGNVRFWSTATGELEGQGLRAHNGKTMVVGFSSDGHWMVTGGTDDVARIWDASTRTAVGPPLRGHAGAVTDACFAPTNDTLATVGSDGTLRRWHVPGGEEIGKPVAADTAALRCVAYSADGSLLATGGASGIVCLWQASTGGLVWALPRKHAGGVNSLAFSPDGQELYSAANDHTALRWDLSRRQDPPRVMQHLDRVMSVATSPGGRVIATGSADYMVRLWDAKTAAPQGRQLGGRASWVFAVAPSPDGNTLATGTADGGVRLWDVKSGQPRGAAMSGHDSWVMSVSFSPDGHQLVSSSQDHTVRLWDVASAAQIGQPLRGHDRQIDTVVFSPRGGLIASGSADQTVRLWDPATGKPVGRPLTGHTGEVPSVAFSPDGRRLASAACDTTVRIWDVQRGQQLGLPWQAHTAQVQAVAFSPSGRWLASAGADRSVRIWNALSGQPVGLPLMAHRAPVWSVSWSPNERLLASGSWDFDVALWDVAAHKLSCPVLKGHQGHVNCVAFLPDGRSVASASQDGTVRIWDARSGRQLAALVSLDGGAGYLAVTPEGYYDGSLEAASLIRWRIGDRLYPFDQFAARYHRPDLVRRALAGEDISAARPLDSTMLPPNVGFLSPKYGSAAPGGTIAVVVQAAGVHPIQRLELAVNGKPVPESAAKQVAVGSSTEPRRTFSATLALPAGEYRARVQAVAYDTEGLRSRVAELLINAPNATRQPGTLHLLAIGLNRYAHLPGKYQLRYAVPDAKSVAEVFATQGGGKPYAEVKTKLLTDEQATLSNLKFALRDLKDSANENDVAVIYISGHGLALPDGSFYFPSHDVDLADIPHTALSWQDFAAALAEVRAKRVLVLADTCHSGGIVGDQALNSDLLATRLNRDAHQMVFTAAARDEVSIAREEWGHGAFSKALVQGLVGLADSDKDGNITFAELRDYVTKRVQELTADRQHPQLPFLDNFEPEAVLARAAWAK